MVAGRSDTGAGSSLSAGREIPNSARLCTGRSGIREGVRRYCTTDGSVFEDYIRELLLHCGRWPQPKSVLVTDNASFHLRPNVRRMCDDAGVILVYASPYSPDLNPIEEFFAELKTFVKKHWCVWEQDQATGFKEFLEWCLATAGSRSSSAEGHFRHSGLTITHS